MASNKEQTRRPVIGMAVGGPGSQSVTEPDNPDAVQPVTPTIVQSHDVENQTPEPATGQLPATVPPPSSSQPDSKQPITDTRPHTGTEEVVDAPLNDLLEANPDPPQHSSVDDHGKQPMTSPGVAAADPPPPPITPGTNKSSRTTRLTRGLQGAGHGFNRVVLTIALIVLLVLVTFSVLRNGFWSTLLHGGFLIVPILAWWIIVMTQPWTKRSADRPIPEIGQQKKTYDRCRRLGITYVPLQSLWELILIEGHKHALLRQKHYGEIGIFGLKGGVGKSTVLAIWLWLSAKFSQKNVLGVDSRHKPGDIVDRLGIRLREEPLEPTDYTTVSIRQALQLFVDDWFRVPRIAETIIGSIEGMTLYVIGADKRSKQRFLNVPLFGRAMDWLSELFKLVLHECSDDIGDDLDLEVMRRVDVPVFIHRLNMLSSDDNLVNQLDGYMDHNDGEFADKIRQHAHLVVLATVDGDTPEKFSELVEGIIPTERVILVPYHSFFDENARQASRDRIAATAQNGKPKPAINFTMMPKVTTLALFRGLNSVTEHLPTISATGVPPLAHPSGGNPPLEYHQSDGDRRQHTQGDTA